MKIGLSGPGGTGKGTISRSIALKVPNVCRIDSPTEFFGKISMPNSKSFKDITDESRKIFQYSAVSAQIQNERFLNHRGVGYVSERSVFDFLAYFSVDGTENEEYKKYEDYVLRAYNLNPYDIIFYCEPDFVPNGSSSPEGDSWKERDSDSRNIRHEFLKRKLFDEKIADNFCKATIIEKLSGSPSDRLSQACSVIKSLHEEKVPIVSIPVL